MPTCRSIERSCLSISAVSFTFLHHIEFFTPHQITPQITTTNVTYTHAPGGRRNAPNRHIAVDYNGNQQAATTNCSSEQHIGLRVSATYLRLLVCAAVQCDALSALQFQLINSARAATRGPALFS